MADVTLETATVTIANRVISTSQVYTSSTTGYQFFINSGIDLVYRKTTDGGANWGAQVTVRTGSITVFTVHYEKWTPGNSGSKIRITYLDFGTDDIFYRDLDTASSDTLSSEVTVFAGVTFLENNDVWTGRSAAITQARGGNIYIVWTGDGGTEFGTCRSTDGGANWTTTLATFTNQGTSWLMAFPANTDDPQDICVVAYTPSTTSLFSYIYDNSADSWGTSTVDNAVTLNAAYFQFDAGVRLSDNSIKLAWWNLTDNAAADLRVVTMNPGAVGANGTTGTYRTNVITNTAEYCQAGVFIDQNTGDLYVCYLGAGTWTSSVHALYKKSTDDGVTWGSQIQFSETLGNHLAIFCDAGGTDSRFAPVWYNAGLQDLLTNVTNSIVIAPSAETDETLGSRRMISVP